MNPYEVLGISPDSSDKEIEDAYYKIVEEYKEDSESDNPLAHLAKEKIAAATEAYNQIKKQQIQIQEPSQFIDIRRLINNNRINESNELLDGVPDNRRDAEWYFLKGTIQYTRGWLEDAYENFKKAIEISPHNTEYRAALNQLEWQRRTGQSYNSGAGGGATPNFTTIQCGACDICAATCCTSICCNAMRC